MNKIAYAVPFLLLVGLSTQVGAQTEKGDAASTEIGDAFDADELAAVTSGPGLCRSGIDINKARRDEKGRIEPGSWLLNVKQTANFDIELVGAGGSGGGATLGNGHPLWGGGGGAGEIKRWVGYSLDKGRYLVQIGTGGKAVSGSSNWHDYRVRPVNGNAGRETAIFRCTSDFEILAAKGGSGGGGDTYDIGTNLPGQHGGNGADLIDPANGNAIGRGGAGGYWQHNPRAVDGGGWGSGGGGEGGHTGQGTQSGQGGDGYARIFKVSGGWEHSK